VSASARPEIAIVGAGLAGALMAAYLGRAGHPVEVFELRPDPRKTEGPSGRSINLALSHRGIHALREVGAADRVLAHALPMRGRMMHAVSGELSFQPYGTEEDQVLHSVSRGRLNEILLDVAEACRGVRLHFGRKCLDLDPETNTIHLEDQGSGEIRSVQAGVVIGADGAFSKIRAALQRRDRFDYRQDYLEHGYKELSLPPKPGGGFALQNDALHIWPRRTYMMIALPNPDETHTCTLFWPFEGPQGFSSVRTDDEILAHFRETFPDVLPLLPDLVEQYRRNPVGSLVTIRCRPWDAGGKVVLIGDACHAVVPFYGQGMNAAFEDCTVLHACLQESGGSRERAFREYEARRKQDVDTLADLALANFVEMRDHVGSRSFLLKKGAERWLHRLFPRWYFPLYTLVTFTRMPYAEAVRRTRRQNRFAGIAAVIAALVLLLVVVLLAW
jgi:kynurenine 3-monooxygenase